MATQLSIVNKVLKRLREEAVTTTTQTSYSALIAEFVADVYDEVRLAHEWEQTKKTVRVDFVQGQTRYNLSDYTSGAGDLDPTSEATLGPDSHLVMNPGGTINAFWYRNDTTTYGEPMFLTNDIDRERIRSYNTDNQQSAPVWFSLTNEADVLYMDTMYVPDSSDGYCNMTFWVQPAPLESDGSTDATVIYLPERPIYLGALFMALNERGEEIGEPGNLAERRYYDALGALIMEDQYHNERTNQYEWSRH